jgi:hypothetical protein
MQGYSPSPAVLDERKEATVIRTGKRVPVQTAAREDGSTILLVRHHAECGNLVFDDTTYGYHRTDKPAGYDVYAPVTISGKTAENWPIGGDRPE